MNPTIRILYAEDNPLDADLTRARFAEQAPDFELQIVATGAACLEQIQRNPPDLLLLDHHLPDTDGVEMLKALFRQAPGLPVVMVTGAGDEDLVLRALRLGAATYVPKRGNYLESLSGLLRDVLANRIRKQDQALPGAAAPRRILYVEHLPMDIDLTLQYFGEHAPHLTVEVVHTCSEALVRLARSPAYDLVLVDLRMPDQSGLDFVREAKLRLPRLPPFIVISGTGDEETAIATLKLGAADYVVKREGYLGQLPIRIDLAIASDGIARNNEELRIELGLRKLAEQALAALQAQLALTSRLAALGTLVAGVAHEINNPLAAALSDQDQAMGAVRELRERLRGNVPLDREVEILHLDEVVEELGEAQEAGRRIERIVRDLKVFGRPNQKDARERIRLIDVVELAMRWMPASIDQTATVTVEDGGAPDVVATPGQITQVVVNLVTNAAKATLEGARGLIVIRVGPGKPGMACIEVIDHGGGIEPAVMPHIFDPFFTTSDVGKGTGLGLSICHAIVAGHGGTLTVVSEVGKGSTFRVELPAAAPPLSSSG
jgi:signal transduction histidine kinase